MKDAIIFISGILIGYVISSVNYNSRVYINIKDIESGVAAYLVAIQHRKLIEKNKKEYLNERAISV